MTRGDRLRLTIERPAAGGRMIARHDGAIVFVAGAIPGEVVEADVEKVQRGTGWAITRQVIEASPDRVADAPDGACGGAVFAHIAYERQRAIKRAIIEDTLRRLGRITLAGPPEVVASPIDGYRMRARLHVRQRRIGFFREGTHQLCDAGPTRQLRDDTIDVVRRLEASLATADRETVGDIELAENLDASQRAVHLELLPDADASRLATLAQVDGLTGASCAHPENPRTIDLFGSPMLSDTIRAARLERHVRSFFQGNRYLLEPLVDYVLAQVAPGLLYDLYAGVGLFSIPAAAGGLAVAAVEGDGFAAADLGRNKVGLERLAVLPMSVEFFLSKQNERPATLIVDPPRTGMSKQAMAGVIRLGASRMIYVSCDIATLARDARLLLDAGYRIIDTRAFDLFPNTAHVETVIAFAR